MSANVRMLRVCVAGFPIHHTQAMANHGATSTLLCRVLPFTVSTLLCPFGGKEGTFPLLLVSPSTHAGCLSSQNTPSPRAKLPLKNFILSPAHLSTSCTLLSSPLFRMQSLHPEVISLVFSPPRLIAGLHDHHRTSKLCSPLT